MQIISLFGGIEGFGLAGHKMGWDLVLSCEIAEFPSLVTKRNFPNTFHHPDIHTLNYETIIKNSRWNPSDTTIVVGGFPCQPYSLAGKRKGKNDDRHLWPEMLRVIQEIQPTWVVGENVPGLVNWSGGVVFEEVQSDLEAEGYEVQSFILPAAGVGAPHRRDRVWIVAYSAVHGHELRRLGEDRFAKGKGESEKYKRERVRDDGRGNGEQGVTSNPTSDRRMWNRSGFASEKGRQSGFVEAGQLEGGFEGLCVQGDASNTKGEQGKRMQPEQRKFSEQGQREFRGINSAMGCGHASNPSNTRLQRGEKLGSIASEWPESDKQPAGHICPDWQNFPTQSPVCDGNDGISADLVRYILRTGGDCYTEEEAEKEAKRIISKVRTEGIKAGGNAIVHQVALQIFKAIEEFELITSISLDPIDEAKPKINF